MYEPPRKYLVRLRRGKSFANRDSTFTLAEEIMRPDSSYTAALGSKDCLNQYSFCTYRHLLL